MKRCYYCGMGRGFSPTCEGCGTPFNGPLPTGTKIRTAPGQYAETGGNDDPLIALGLMPSADLQRIRHRERMRQMDYVEPPRAPRENEWPECLIEWPDGRIQVVPLWRPMANLQVVSPNRGFVVLAIDVKKQ